MNQYRVTANLHFTVYANDEDGARETANRRLTHYDASMANIIRTVEIAEQWTLAKMHKEGIKLVAEWCEQNDGDCQYVYCPDYLACKCGIDKNHVHCQHGKVIEVG